MCDESNLSTELIQLPEADRVDPQFRLSDIEAECGSQNNSCPDEVVEEEED